MFWNRISRHQIDVFTISQHASQHCQTRAREVTGQFAPQCLLRAQGDKSSSCFWLNRSRLFLHLYFVPSDLALSSQAHFYLLSLTVALLVLVYLPLFVHRCLYLFTMYDFLTDNPGESDFPTEQESWKPVDASEAEADVEKVEPQMKAGFIHKAKG